MFENVKRCSCNHEYQDFRYGKGMRVHTPINKSDNKAKWRCTVCGKER